MRRFAVLVILLAGCSEAPKPAKRTKKEEPKSSYVSLWKPDPEPAPKPAPPPPPPAPPAPDPAAEQLKAEAAKRKEEERRRQAKVREFAGMSPYQRRHLALTADALAAKGLANLTNDELTLISHFPLQFADVKAADLDEALGVYGDKKGAREHLARLNITDPDMALKVRAAFGLATDIICADARAAGEELAAVGSGGVNDKNKRFIAAHPDFFPSRAAAQPRAEKPASEKPAGS
jgi:hypothetical protein